DSRRNPRSRSGCERRYIAAPHRRRRDMGLAKWWSTRAGTADARKLPAKKLPPIRDSAGDAAARSCPLLPAGAAVGVGRRCRRFAGVWCDGFLIQDAVAVHTGIELDASFGHRFSVADEQISARFKIFVKTL